ncbi:hypothetical protein DFH06DRAFT_1125306 [Mycena polygramma]|nr:hypothetical protein DFH06DRAFT_1125306 [Mycena polygramma]
MAHPPMKSKYCTGPTDYELEILRKAARNEKARLRMARGVRNLDLVITRRREELKYRSLEEQARAKARHREHQATYREKNRLKLNASETTRRNEAYKAKYGNTAYSSYLKAKRRRRLARQAANEAYHSGDNFDSDDGHERHYDDAQRHDRVKNNRDSSEESGGGDSGYDGDSADEPDGDTDDDRADCRRVLSDGRGRFDGRGRRFDAIVRDVLMRTAVG